MPRATCLFGVLFFAALACLAGSRLIGATTAPASYSLCTDDGLCLSLTADGQVAALTIDGEPLPINPGPALWVRDMSQAGQVGGPNLLANHGFEDGMDDWQISAQMGTLITRTDAVSHTGGWALQLHGIYTDTRGRAAVEATPVSVLPGQRYRLSGYFLSSRGFVPRPDGTPPRRQDQIWRGESQPDGLYLRWRDGEEKPLEELTLVAPLHWEAYQWRKLSGEVRAPPDAAYLQVVIGAGLQDETVWVDDLSLIASPEVEQPVAGVVAPVGDQLIQTATITTGLHLTAAYTAAADHIAVHIELQDTAGVNRALEVVFGAPLDLASGWQWWDDVRHSRTITVGSAVASPPPEYPLPSGLSWTYEHIVSGVWDAWLPISLYPYALVQDDRHGLALAVSLDSPRLVKLAYDQEQKRYEARGYLGLSPLATRLAGQADLSLELYRVDPTWGFRAAMDRFAARHPAWFDSPRPMYQYTGYERGHYGGESGAQHVLASDLAGIFTAEYIVAEGVVKDGPTSDPLPTYEETIGEVQAMLSSTQAIERAKAEAITQSVAYSPNGDWMIKHVGEYSWAPGVWELAWATSTDPDIEGGWGPLLWDWAVGPVLSDTEAISAVLDGVMMDNFLSAPGVDIRPEHLALTDTPLTYHVAAYQPGVHNAANVHEFFVWLRDALTARGRDDMAITINFWGIGAPNGLARHIDGFGGEGNSKTKPVNWVPRILDYRRAIAYHRPQAWSNGESDLTLDDVQAFADQALFYGIFPQRKEDAIGWEPGANQLLTDTQEVLLQFASAGWEPIPHAWTDNAAVWVERFGDGTRPSGTEPPAIYFTVHNTLTETAPFTLTVDAPALGFGAPAALQITELVSGDAAPFQVWGEQVQIGGELEPLDTLVFRLTTYRLYLPLIYRE